MTTKAARIRGLYAQGHLTIQQIAAKVGCSDAYVRVCARQRADGRLSKADLAYLSKPGTLEGMRVYRKIRYATGDRRAAAMAWRDTYYRLRYEVGLPPHKAHLKAVSVAAGVRVKTSSKLGRRQAILAAKRVRQEHSQTSGDHGQQQNLQRV